MAKGTNQKLKLYYLAKTLLEKTDDTHYITMPEIIEALARNEVSAERKSIYTDLKLLNDIGIEVEGEPFGKSFRYHVISRPFEVAELKLLVDSIQASKFITERKSNQLIHKLESLVSEHDAKQLQRQVFVSDRIKTMNESIYYNVDEIHRAIAENRKVRFQYFQWNIKKEMELRHDGAFYHISPWGLSWNEENYYLIGYDSNAGKIKHYRVDKMKNISMSDEPREGENYFKKQNLAAYTKKSFGMFGGEEYKVKLHVDNSLAGVMIDRFGKDIMMFPIDDNHFSVNVDVQLSSQFIGWIFSLGEGVKIAGPDEVLQRVDEEINRLVKMYKKEDLEKT